MAEPVAADPLADDVLGVQRQLDSTAFAEQAPGGSSGEWVARQNDARDGEGRDGVPVDLADDVPLPNVGGASHTTSIPVVSSGDREHIAAVAENESLALFPTYCPACSHAAGEWVSPCAEGRWTAPWTLVDAAALDAERARSEYVRGLLAACEEESTAASETSRQAAEQLREGWRKALERAERAEAAIARARTDLAATRAVLDTPLPGDHDEREQAYRDGWNDAASATTAALETETP